jgi:1-deoxy-D-xylulose-5-phosphate synthase
LDRAGLVGEDGPTHSGNYDIAYLRCIPNIILMTPSDENETRILLSTAFYHQGPAAVRYPRGTGPNTLIEPNLTSYEIGKANLIREGSSKIIFLNFGALLEEAKIVADEMNLTLIDMRFVKPLDQNILKKYLLDAEYFISLEDGSISGGAGSAVQEFCSIENIDIRSKLFGIPDRFIEHASRAEMIEDCGLTAKQMLTELRTMLAK